MKEIWRIIAGFSYHKISTLGNVESLNHYAKHFKSGVRLVKGKKLKPFLNKDGYYQIDIYENGKHNLTRINRLVAMTFPDLVDWTEEAKGKPFEEIDVNHKDQNKLNNYVGNLEWCTKKYNNNYGNRNDNIGKTKSIPVEQHTIDMVLIKEYPSAKEAERQTGILRSCICMCCKGKLKTAGGYVWRYKD